jgi:hypothetical protein
MLSFFGTTTLNFNCLSCVLIVQSPISGEKSMQIFRHVGMPKRNENEVQRVNKKVN